MCRECKQATRTERPRTVLSFLKRLAIEGCVDMVAACTGAIERASNQSEPVGEEARDCNVRAEQKRVRMSKLDRTVRWVSL